MNDKYFFDVYNGMGNLTSIFKAPLFASKPAYYECDNLFDAKPEITPLPYTPSNPDEQDDIDLYYDSWIDIEPYSGAVLRAAQKLMISAFIEKDELFENDNRFIPIYYVFRSGNFTEESVKEIFGDLIVGLSFKLIFISLSVAIVTLSVALLVFSYMRKQQSYGSTQIREAFISQAE